MMMNVIFVSVWDGGHEIESNAKYNEETKLVYDIEVVEGVNEDGDEVQVLDEEYIMLPNGEKLEVYEEDGKYYTRDL